MSRSPGVSAGKQMVRVKRCFYGSTHHILATKGTFTPTLGFTVVAAVRTDNFTFSNGVRVCSFCSDGNNEVDCFLVTVASTSSDCAFYWRKAPTSYASHWGGAKAFFYGAANYATTSFVLSWRYDAATQYVHRNCLTTGTSKSLPLDIPNPVDPTFTHVGLFSLPITPPTYNHRGFGGPLAIWNRCLDLTELNVVKTMMWDLEKISIGSDMFGYWKFNQYGPISVGTVIPNYAPAPICGNGIVNIVGNGLWRYSPLEML